MYLDELCKNIYNAMPSREGYWIFETKDERRYYGIAGALMKRQSPQQIVTNYLTDVLIDEYSSKINQSGGQVIFSKTRLQDMGHTAVCLEN
jgi:predicted enzyme related to lactoylglutathione lyase